MGKSESQWGRRAWSGMTQGKMPPRGHAPRALNLLTGVVSSEFALHKICYSEGLRGCEM